MSNQILILVTGLRVVFVKDRRNGIRILVEGYALVYVGDERLRLSLIDISAQGLGVLKPSTGTLVIGQFLSVILSCPPYFFDLPLSGVVTHISGDRAGLKCTSVSQKARSILKLAVSNLMIDLALIYDRRASLCYDWGAHPVVPRQF